MELKEWIALNLNELGSLYLYPKSVELFPKLLSTRNALVINNIQNYYQCTVDNELIFYSCIKVIGNHVYYVLWDGNRGYKVKINRDYHEILPIDLYFHRNIYGDHNWVETIKVSYPTLLKDCGDCSCYNDKLVTGWCPGKIPGALLWS